MTTRRTTFASIAMAGMLALSACGGGDSDSSSTTPAAGGSSASTSAAATTSAAASSSSAAASSGGSNGGYDAAKCSEAAKNLMDMASVGLDALTGEFDQAKFDSAFPTGMVDKLPSDLQSGYSELEKLARDLVGKSAAEASEASAAFSEKMTTYSQQLSKECTP